MLRWFAFIAFIHVTLAPIGSTATAQGLADALRCGMDPTHDVCIANELRRFLSQLESGEGDAHWSFWYQTQLELRDPGLVPIIETATEQIENESYKNSVRAARLAFDKDFAGARSKTDGIVETDAVAQAVLGIAGQLIRHENVPEALGMLTAAMGLAETISDGAKRINFVEELALLLTLAGGTSEAQQTLEIAHKLVRSNDFPENIAAVAIMPIAGATCRAIGDDAGRHMLTDALAAVAEIGPTRHRFFTANAYAYAGRGFGRCDDKAAAAEWASKAFEAARGLTTVEKIRVLENLYGGSS